MLDFAPCSQEAAVKRPLPTGSAIKTLPSIYPTTSIHVGELDDDELEHIVMTGEKPRKVRL